MGVSWVVKLYLVLAVRLEVPCVESGNWQHCQKVSPKRCSVGDSRSGGPTYRYDIGGYGSQDPESYDYKGPFKLIGLGKAFMSCYNCTGDRNVSGSSATGEVVSATLSPSQLDITNLLIVDHNVGTMSSGDTSALSDLPCGTYCHVWLVNCNITTIEAGAFAKLSQVKTLVIWRSNLQTLKSGTFAGMEGLKDLLLLDNNITCLEAGTFDGLPKLGYLYLVENQILTMPVGMLRGLQLDWLDVSMNSISHIAPGVLQEAGPVRQIYFVKNKLQSVSVGMFAELEQLRQLYLQHNEISSIADGAFLSNKLLQRIVLSGNKLTFLSGLWFPPGKAYTHVNGKGIYADVIAKKNAIAVVVHASRLLNFVLQNNPLRCTCANIGLYERMWMLWKVGWYPTWRFMISFQTGCPAISLLRTPPVAVNASALPCPAPVVEIVNVERNQYLQVYTAFGNVYWEDLSHVFWSFANGSEYSMNITHNTNTTAHASLPIGNLTVSVVTYIKAEGWVKCKGSESKAGSWKHESCSNYMGKSTFTLWLRTVENVTFTNFSYTVVSEIGSHTAYFDTSLHLSQPRTTSLAQSTIHTQPTTLTEPTTHEQQTTYVQPTAHTPPLPTSTSLWTIVLSSLAAILMVLTRIAWRYSTEAHRVARQNDRENYSVEGAPGPREGVARLPSGSSAIVPYAVAYGDTVSNAGSSDEQITPYAITYDVEDDDITPYAEGHLRDHDSLCESDASDSSEIVPYGVSKICDKYDRKETQENTPVTYRNDNLSSEGPVSETYGKDEPKETILNDSVNGIIHQPGPAALPGSDRSVAACSAASPLPEAAAIDTQAAPIDTETADASNEDDSKREQVISVATVSKDDDEETALKETV
ncbi:PREDICTED: uncharacterized protein LOC109481788 [Branchiostoma belcheri]|uniref:Uncharacterized protein LOC109481788 n=1 Tax=Branchiostoma belcheri TaxID=7741 RepID=A0A6P5A9B7_BRABE|nr:PREDICTED: uncharacterized protein LOC109481788 [Branchiostoma belcheri]